MIVTGNTRRPRNVECARAAAFFMAIGAPARLTLSAWLCRRRLRFVLAHPGHVSPDRLGGGQLHGHLQALPRRRGSVRQVRHRSVIISIVGAFLLVADYIVTAALSALSAFDYLGWSHRKSVRRGPF